MQAVSGPGRREEALACVRDILAELLESVDKRLKCGKCGARSRDRYNLDRHMQLHVLQQPKLLCTKSWCETPFSTKFELMKHVKDCRFFCHLCGRVIKKTGRDKGHLKLCSKRSEAASCDTFNEKGAKKVE